MDSITAELFNLANGSTAAGDTLAAKICRDGIKAIERLRAWQQTPSGAYCSGDEQLNRILAGLVREYGRDGVLTLSNVFANEVQLGQQIKWGCTGGTDDFIVIREAADAARET